MIAYSFLNYHLDEAVFVALTLVTLWVSRRIIRRRNRRGKFPVLFLVLIVLLVAGGLGFARYAEHNERGQIRRLVAGLAPTFAHELEAMGHGKITPQTPPDDPAYLAVIEREKAWLKFNPDVADIYTYRRLPDGKIVFIADSETDYNHDGKYEGEREQRTAIGEPYETPTKNTLKALAGQPVFDDEIVTDEWGTWVSFDQPMFDAQGRVEGVLGVDFPADAWISSILTARATSLAIAYILILTLISSGSLNILMRAEIEERKRTEVALIVAKEEADRSNRAKSDFLASMSHEIRTPMNGIIGFGSLLLETPLNPEQRDFVLTLSKSADSLLALINDILDLSKIEAGHVDLEHVPYPLDETIDDLHLLLATTAEEKGLAFRVNNHAAGLVLSGDPHRLRQVLMNLLGNALKFTSHGEVVLDVSWTPSPAAPYEGLLRCAVRDTGIGIPADKIDRLFQKFSQVDASTTRRYGGTGLGLVISQELTRLMGGRIGVISTPGKGSIFTLEIPSKIGVKTVPPSTPAASSPRFPDGSRGHALLAEDNAINQKLAEFMLRKLGYRIDIAINGHEAVRMATAGAYDVILLDCEMPELDGLSATRAIRASEPVGHRVPIIAITANAMMGTREKCLAAGMDIYLTKPIQLDRLRTALDSVHKPA
ncbi:MAG: ATP-binding protein [Opitutaceae bacterium]|jgi:hypothetical protein